MPSNKEIYEGESRRSMYEVKTQFNKRGVKNTKDDVDFTLFSITKFFRLLKSGDFNMMEMLHAPENKILINCEYMEFLTSIRKSLLVNDISAFLGFIKKEHKRYGVNIYHYKVQEEFLNFLGKFDDNLKLINIWDKIQSHAKNNSHIIFTESITGNGNLVPSIKIAQRLHQSTVNIGYIKKSITHTLDTYGHRQKGMKIDGVEFKGLYHALRLIYEANDLFDFGEFKLPFDQDRHKLLLDIKSGNIEQQELFSIIDAELDLLYQREKTCLSNKPMVSSLIDRLMFNLEAEKKINYCMRGG